MCDGHCPLDRAHATSLANQHQHLGSACRTLGILLLATTALHVMGRPLMCPCGYVKISHGGIDDREVSQHFIDTNTYSHLTHRILRGAVPRNLARPPVMWGLPIAAALGGAWEVVENTPMIIRSYALTTVVPDDAGGSIINSIGDILAAGPTFSSPRSCP
jgi:hypothetical protein